MNATGPRPARLLPWAPELTGEPVPGPPAPRRGPRRAAGRGVLLPARLAWRQLGRRRRGWPRPSPG